MLLHFHRKFHFKLINQLTNQTYSETVHLIVFKNAVNTGDLMSKSMNVCAEKMT